MFKKATYKSVVDMARHAADDPAFADDLDKHIAGRQLVKRLFALRCARGLSQADIAVKMGCTQGRISKLEASRDEDLSLGDIRAYAQALGLTTLLGLEEGPTALARVKFHQACVRREVSALAKSAMTHEGVAEGVTRFFGQTALGSLDILEEATKNRYTEVPSLGDSVVLVGPDDTGGHDVSENCEPQATATMPKRPRSAKAGRA